MAEVLRTGTDATFLSVGPCTGTCLKAAEMLESEGFSIGVVDARFIKPLDTEMLESIFHTPIVTVEENTLVGGFGSAVLEYFESHEILHRVNVHRIGLPDEFDAHATREEQLTEHGLVPAGLAKRLRKYLNSLAHRISTEL